jgi:hypothetical protein
MGVKAEINFQQAAGWHANLAKWWAICWLPPLLLFIITFWNVIF